MVKDLMKWTARSFSKRRFLKQKALTDAFIGVQPPRNDSEEDNKKAAKPCINLLIDQEGYPILLTWDVTKNKGSSYKKCLVSKFMAKMYCK